MSSKVSGKILPPIFAPRKKFFSSLKMRAMQITFEDAQKDKVRWCYAWGIWEIRGKSNFSLQHKDEDDFGSAAPGIIGVND
jgi:hypothetical protein